MENASKALIIAGAILLSILIIGLGMFIYQQAAGSMAGANLNPQKVEAYNAPFLNYEGKQSGTQAKALYNLIRNHNSANADDTTLQIELDIGTDDYAAGDTKAASETAITMPANSIKSANTYNITFAVDPNSGLITACKMNKQ